MAVAPIRFYQYFLSPLLPPLCRYTPTCSAYAIEAIMAHGFLRGSWLALLRIVRCNPLGGCGYDPVPAPAANTHRETPCVSKKL